MQVVGSAFERGIEITKKQLSHLVVSAAIQGKVDIAEALVLYLRKNKTANEEGGQEEELEEEDEEEENTSTLYGGMNTKPIEVLIRTYLNRQQIEKAHTIFLSAIKAGHRLSASLLAGLVLELSRQGLIPSAKEVLDEMYKNDLQLHQPHLDTFLYACSQTGHAALGWQVLSAEMAKTTTPTTTRKKTSTTPTQHHNQVVYNALLCGASTQVKMDVAENIMRNMANLRMKPSCAAYAAVIKGYIRKTQTSKALEKLREAVEEGVDLAKEFDLFELLISLFSKMKDAKTTWEIFGIMRKLGMKQNETTFEKLLLLALEKQDMGKTLEILNVMKEQNFRLDSLMNAGVALLRFFAKVEVNELRLLFESCEVGTFSKADPGLLAQVFDIAKKNDDKELMFLTLKHMKGGKLPNRDDLSSLLRFFVDTRQEEVKAALIATVMIQQGFGIEESVMDSLVQQLMGKDSEGKSDLAFQLFSTMKDRGIKPSHSTFKMTVERCPTKGRLAELRKLVAEWYGNDEELAEDIGKREATLSDPAEELRCILPSCQEEKYREQALAHLRVLQASGRDWGDYPSRLFDECIKANDENIAFSVIEMMGADASTPTQYSKLLQVCIAKENISIVTRLLIKMQARHVKPPVDLWDGLIATLSRARLDVHLCLDLLRGDKEKERENEKGNEDEKEEEKPEKQWELSQKTWEELLASSIGAKDIAATLEVITMMEERDKEVPKDVASSVRQWCKKRQVVPSKALFHLRLKEAAKQGNVVLMKETLKEMKRARAAANEKTLALVMQVCIGAITRQQKPKQKQRKKGGGRELRREEMLFLVRGLEGQGLLLRPGDAEQIVTEVWNHLVGSDTKNA